MKMTGRRVVLLLGLAALAWGPIEAQEEYYLFPGRAGPNSGFGCPPGLVQWIGDVAGEWDVVCSALPPFWVWMGELPPDAPLMLVQHGAYPYLVVRTEGEPELRLAVKVPMAAGPDEAELLLVPDATQKAVRLGVPDAVLELHDYENPVTYVAFDLALDASQREALAELARGGEVRVAVPSRKPVIQKLSKRNLAAIDRMLKLRQAALAEAR
jgi:hypothetical protein